MTVSPAHPDNDSDHAKCLESGRPVSCVKFECARERIKHSDCALVFM